MLPVIGRVLSEPGNTLPCHLDLSQGGRRVTESIKYPSWQGLLGIS